MRFLASLAAVAAVGVVHAQEAVDAATFSTIIQYTRFARASYAAKCASPPNGSVVLDYLSDSVNEGQATIFRWDSAKQIIVAFRGTSSPKDWDIDLNYGLQNLTVPGSDCSACQASTGFQTQFNGLAQQVLNGVKKALRGYCEYDIILTGHSLGGALSALASITLSKNGLRPAKIYTYGEPRNGNAAYSAYIDGLVGKENYWRITHSNDGVPQFPPASLGLAHHGTEYWEKATGYNNTRETVFYCPAAAGSESSTVCNQAQNYGDVFINYGHVTYSNDVTGNALHVHDCGAPYPGASTQPSTTTA